MKRKIKNLHIFFAQFLFEPYASAPTLSWNRNSNCAYIMETGYILCAHGYCVKFFVVIFASIGECA